MFVYLLFLMADLSKTFNTAITYIKEIGKNLYLYLYWDLPSEK